jgi:hypothetical protein
LLPVTQCFVLLRIFLKIPLFEGWATLISEYFYLRNF